MSCGAAHWDAVYGARAEEELTWFEAAPDTSLELIRPRLRAGEPFIDVGAGASRLVDRLLDEGCGPLSALDLSGAALDVSRRRLGPRAEEVEWIEADVTNWRPGRAYALWHDRAVFHFLTAPEARAAYARVMAEALRPGGAAVIASFADDGPERCSGLPVVRYSPESLAEELERWLPGRLRLAQSLRREHVTPKGVRQKFQYSLFEMAG